MRVASYVGWPALGFAALACQIADGKSLPTSERLAVNGAKLATALGTTQVRAQGAAAANAVRSGQQAKILHDADRNALRSASCPEGMSEFKGFCVDRYEAHLVVRKSDGSYAPYPAHERPVAGERYEARSQAGFLPQAYISRIESAAACENAGKRLCSVVEWYSACRGSEENTYPYGATFERKLCNVGKGHLLSRFFGTNPRNWRYDEHFNNPALNQLPGFLAKTGEYSQCTNDSGTFDMVGNVHEWVSDTVDESLAQKLPLRDGIRRAVRRTHGHGIFMGGFFSTMHEHGNGCKFVTIGHEPRYHDYSTGFRCCKDR